MSIKQRANFFFFFWKFFIKIFGLSKILNLHCLKKFQILQVFYQSIKKTSRLKIVNRKKVINFFCRKMSKISLSRAFAKVFSVLQKSIENLRSRAINIFYSLSIHFRKFFSLFRAFHFWNWKKQAEFVLFILYRNFLQRCFFLKYRIKVRRNKFLFLLAEKKEFFKSPFKQ